MKATKLLIAAAAFTGLASLSFAGPGPEYWARMNAAAKKPATPSIGQIKPADNKAAPVATVSTTCTACQGCQAKKS